MKPVTVSVVFVAIVLALACARGDDNYIQHKVDLTGASPQESYVALNCAKCHGPDLEGQRTAPKLTGIAERWSEDDLITYLRNPTAYQAQNPRLAYLAERYPIEMPAYSHTDEQALRGLASWLLEQ
ncbi:MAG: cytochrome c [Holophagae bacterium]|jgi:cytochrome c553